MLSRRNMLRAIAYTSSFAFFPSAVTKSAFSEIRLQQAPGVPDDQEVYAGFLLLPEGTEPPDTIQPAELGVPIFCGVQGQEITAITEIVDSPESLAEIANFPIYELDSSDGTKLRVKEAFAYKHKTGEVYSAAISYEVWDETVGEWVLSVSISARPDFPRPMPMFIIDHEQFDLPSPVVEKVSFLPSLGLLVQSREGFISHWIENDVLYNLYDERGKSREQAEQLANQLKQVSLEQTISSARSETKVFLPLINRQ